MSVGGMVKDTSLRNMFLIKYMYINIKNFFCNIKIAWNTRHKKISHAKN